MAWGVPSSSLLTLSPFIIGVPILVLEIGFGQFWQTGDGSLRPSTRLRGVGVASVAWLMLVVYYSVLIAWVINFFDLW
jgi:solute carrier family 6 GABA transporter-like protein 1